MKRNENPRLKGFWCFDRMNNTFFTLHHRKLVLFHVIYNIFIILCYSTQIKETFVKIISKKKKFLKKKKRKQKKIFIIWENEFILGDNFPIILGKEMRMF